MSAQKLSDRCAELGHPIARSVIANLESGRRGSVTVAELTILGAALDVPPALLLYDLRRQAEVEALPGKRSTPWTAYLWFIGDSPLSVVDGVERRWVDLDEVDFERWRNAQLPRLLHIEHASLIEEFWMARAELDGEKDEDRQKLARQRVRKAALRLRLHRAAMRADDVEPSDLDGELAGIMASVEPKI